MCSSSDEKMKLRTRTDRYVLITFPESRFVGSYRENGVIKMNFLEQDQELVGEKANATATADKW